MTIKLSEVQSITLHNVYDSETESEVNVTLNHVDLFDEHYEPSHEFEWFEVACLTLENKWWYLSATSKTKYTLH